MAVHRVPRLRGRHVLSDRAPITTDDAFLALSRPALLLDDDLRVVRANPAACTFMASENPEGSTLRDLIGDDVTVAERFSLQPITTSDGRSGFVAIARADDDPHRQVGDMRRHFLRTLSHELRTPLTSVIGYAETLRVHRDRLDDEKVGDLLGRLSRNAMALRALMDDLLDVDRLARGGLALDLMECDVSDAVLRAVEMQGARPGRVRVRAEHVMARVDVGRVERIVDNLVANALKHGGRDAIVWVTLDEVDGDVVLVVSDDGVGISPGDRARVFLPFEQGLASRSDASPGAGVGLNLVRELARRHGGDVALREREGGGLSAVVRWPVAGPPTTA